MIVLSSIFRKYVSEHYKKRDENIIVLPHGTFETYKEVGNNQTEASEWYGEHPDSINFLFFGRIEYYKGLDLLIDALSQIKNSNWFLDICGSATQVGDSYVYALASKLGNKVNLNLKYLSDNEIDNAFERSDLVVLPYRKSFIAQSVVMTEAVLHDKPVIVGSTSENSVDVIKYQLGWIFDCESVSSLAATIDMALDLIQKNKFALPKRDAYLKTISKLGVAEQIYFGYDNAELLHNSKL